MGGGLRASRLLAVLAIGLASCAREEMPPGTGPDFAPPAVVEMYPVHGSAVPGLDEDAYVRFDEPLGDSRSVPRLVETSPAGLYDIRAGRRDVRIRPRDGWRPGVVYMFRIPPGLRDLIRNQTREPIELLFTTGPELSETRTTGTVWDRETVRAVRGASVQVIGADSVPYAAVADTGGNFLLPSLPVGDYWAFAFRDQNQNRTLDRDFEPDDSGRVSLPESASVVRLEFWLTEPDSTAPMIGSAEVEDSLTLRVEFDDLLEPDAPLDSATVTVSLADTGEEWPVSRFAVGPLNAVDSTLSGAVGPEEAALPSVATGDSISGTPDVSVDSATERGQATRARPQRFVTVRLGRALGAGTYDVRASGFVNVRFLTGGGATTVSYEPPAAVPETSPEGEAADEGEDAADAGVEEAGH